MKAIKTTKTLFSVLALVALVTSVMLGFSSCENPSNVEPPFNPPVTETEEPAVEEVIEEETEYFNVTFYGYDNNCFKKETVAKGEKVEKPSEEPTKEGYDFLGWVVREGNSSREYDFDEEEVTENLYFHSVWNIKTFTVTFLNDDDSVIESYEEVTYGTPLSRYFPKEDPKSKRCLSRFNGWNSTDNRQYSVSDKIHSDYEFKASYIPTLYIELYFNIDKFKLDGPVFDENKQLVDSLKLLATHKIYANSDMNKYYKPTDYPQSAFRITGRICWKDANGKLKLYEQISEVGYEKTFEQLVSEKVSITRKRNGVSENIELVLPYDGHFSTSTQLDFKKDDTYNINVNKDNNGLGILSVDQTYKTWYNFDLEIKQ